MLETIYICIYVIRLISTKEDLLVEAQLGKARMRALVEDQAQKSQILLEQQLELALENEKASEELLALKMHIATIQNEAKQIDRFDTFVQKHDHRGKNDRKNHLHPVQQPPRRQQSPLTNELREASKPLKQEVWTNMHSNVAKASAATSDEKVRQLIAHVKRVLPQQVPTLNQLLQRLHVMKSILRDIYIYMYLYIEDPFLSE
jgi:hypothetical protein